MSSISHLIQCNIQSRRVGELIEKSDRVDIKSFSEGLGYLLNEKQRFQDDHMNIIEVNNSKITLAGGCLRDLFFGYEPDDIDVFVYFQREVDHRQFKKRVEPHFEHKVEQELSHTPFGEYVTNLPNTKVQVIVDRMEHSYDWNMLNGAVAKKRMPRANRVLKFNFGLNRVWVDFRTGILDWSREFEKDLLGGIATLYCDADHDDNYSVAKGLEKWGKWKTQGKDFGKLRLGEKVMNTPSMMVIPNGYDSKRLNVWHHMFMD